MKSIFFLFFLSISTVSIPMSISDIGFGRTLGSANFFFNPIIKKYLIRSLLVYLGPMFIYRVMSCGFVEALRRTRYDLMWPVVDLFCFGKLILLRLQSKIQSPEEFSRYLKTELTNLKNEAENEEAGAMENIKKIVTSDGNNSCITEDEYTKKYLDRFNTLKQRSIDSMKNSLSSVKHDSKLPDAYVNIVNDLLKKNGFSENSVYLSIDNSMRDDALAFSRAFCPKDFFDDKEEQGQNSITFNGRWVGSMPTSRIKSVAAHELTHLIRGHTVFAELFAQVCARMICSDDSLADQILLEKENQAHLGLLERAKETIKNNKSKNFKISISKIDELLEARVRLRKAEEGMVDILPAVDDAESASHIRRHSMLYPYTLYENHYYKLSSIDIYHRALA